MLSWDGLHLLLPAALEPVALHPGYLRLLGQGQSLELRFAAERRPFDPIRDGKRLQRGAGLAVTGLEPRRPSTTAALPGALYGDGRLYAYRLPEGAVVALLYSQAPEFDEVVSLAQTMRWTPPEGWRQWHCLDLSFDSPPRMRLLAARQAPGSLSITLQRSGSVLTLSRLTPADVLLAGSSLANLAVKLVTGLKPSDLRVIADNLVDYLRPNWPWARLSPIFPWLGGDLRGRIAHDRRNNRILLVREQGRLLPQDEYQRLVESYVASQQG